MILNFEYIIFIEQFLPNFKQPEKIFLNSGRDITNYDTKKTMFSLHDSANNAYMSIIMVIGLLLLLFVSDNLSRVCN